MRQTINKLLIIGVLTFWIDAFHIEIVCSQRNAYEGYYLWTKTFPELWDPPAWPGDREIQGVTHDDANWYFTWTNDAPDIGFLWKVPVWVDLGNSAELQVNTTIKDMRQFPDLNKAVYWHWGDPDHYKYNGIDYIVIPMTGPNSAVGIFRASDLIFIGYGVLTGRGSIGWCAIHPISGELYTSEDFDYIPRGSSYDCDDQSQHPPYLRCLFIYSIPWDTLSTGYIGEFSLTSKGSEELLDVNSKQLEIYDMQGGEFTDSGELLYISSGSGCCLGIGAGQNPRYDGIHVFETKSWKEIKRSTNRVDRSYFDYYYILGCDGAFGVNGSWSPEGLTIWDLNDGKSPHIRGQLHVLVFHKQIGWANEEAFEHFDGNIYVDGINGIAPAWQSWGKPFVGDPARPFKTFGDACNWFPAWDGAQIVIKAGSYPETGTFTRRVRVVSEGGPVILGK